jgi:Ca2+-binding RTX toxin-like protein
MKATFRRLIRLPALMLSRTETPRRKVTSRRNCLRLESLEDRSLLTASCTSFSSGDLTIDGDGTGETITVGASAGDVTLNGSQLLCGGVPVPAANVDSLTINGNGGNDTISALGVTSATFTHGSLSGNISINGGNDNDTILGTRLRETISGGSGNDLMAGYDGDDTMDGGSGSDTFKYDSSNIIHGADTITEYNGVGEIDTIDFADAIFAISLDISSSSFQFVNASYVGIDLNSGSVIENVLGTAYGDTIIGNDQDNNITGNASADIIYGGDGDDYITGDDGNDILVDSVDGDDILLGGNNNDLLIAGLGDDIQAGGAGDDTIYGSDGNDALAGGSGSDTYIFDASPTSHDVDTITDENNAGDVDTLDFSSFPYAVDVDISDASLQVVSSTYLWIDLNAGDVIENVKGSAYDDFITGNTQNNELEGNGGSDIILAGDGSDVLRGGDGNDYLFGQNGTDSIFGNDGDDWLEGGADVDTLDGGGHVSGDTQKGGGGVDIVTNIEVYIP